MKRILLAVLIGLLPATVFAVAGDIPLEKAHINVKDKASLQRGAKYYMNFCSGCHSLQYMRYKRMAEDMGIHDRDSVVYEDLVKKHLIFTDAKIGDTIETAMPLADAAKWFGVPPPDLSLIARVRGVDWLYTYLISFYVDEERPWGANNLLFPDVAMPNVLLPLQGIVAPVYRVDKVAHEGEVRHIEVVDHLRLIQSGDMGPLQFKAAVRDMVNFLAYVAEPVKLKRISLGLWVLGFLFLLAIFAYYLKKEYWKDVY